MSRRVRLFLLAGCGLVAALEAPQAGSSLAAGLSGPYCSSNVVRARAERAAALSIDLSGALRPALAPLAVGSVIESPSGAGRGGER